MYDLPQEKPNQAEETLYRRCFQNYLYSSKLFQIPSEHTIYCPCFQIFQVSSVVRFWPYATVEYTLEI